MHPCFQQRNTQNLKNAYPQLFMGKSDPVKIKTLQVCQIAKLHKRTERQMGDTTYLLKTGAHQKPLLELLF